MGDLRHPLLKVSRRVCRALHLLGAGGHSFEEMGQSEYSTSQAQDLVQAEKMPFPMLLLTIGLLTSNS